MNATKWRIEKNRNGQDKYVTDFNYLEDDYICTVGRSRRNNYWLRCKNKATEKQGFRSTKQVGINNDMNMQEVLNKVIENLDEIII